MPQIWPPSAVGYVAHGSIISLVSSGAIRVDRAGPDCEDVKLCLRVVRSA